MHHQRPLEKENKMGRSRTERKSWRCRKHSEHLEFRGVCPFCLRERLSSLGSPSSSYDSSSSTASSDSSPATLCSTCSGASSYVASPALLWERSGREWTRLSVSQWVVNGEWAPEKPERITKSRSLGYCQKNGEREEEEGGKERKKAGFWSRLLGRMDRNGSILLHSKAVEEEDSLFTQ